MVNPKLDSLYQRLPTLLCAFGWFGRILGRLNIPTCSPVCVPVDRSRSNLVLILLISELLYVCAGWSCDHLSFYGPQEWRKWIWALNFEGSPMCRRRADFSAHLIDRLAISAILRRYRLTGTDHLAIKEHSQGSKFPDIDTFIWSLVSAHYNRRILSAL